MGIEKEMEFDYIFEEPLEFIDIKYTHLNKIIRYEKRSHGKWKKVGTSTMCSVCEHGWGKGHAPKDLKDYNFCPNCGATMDEGSDWK